MWRSSLQKYAPPKDSFSYYRRSKRLTLTIEIPQRAKTLYGHIYTLLYSRSFNLLFFLLSHLYVSSIRLIFIDRMVFGGFVAVLTNWNLCRLQYCFCFFILSVLHSFRTGWARLWNCVFRSVRRFSIGDNIFEANVHTAHSSQCMCAFQYFAGKSNKQLSRIHLK